jgi:hypothetical protein
LADQSGPFRVNAFATGGTLIAVDAAAFASVVGGPVVEVSDATTLNMQSASPAPIVDGTMAAPVAAAPVRSMFQTASIAMRTIVDADWIVQAGRTAWMEDVTW